MTAKIVDLQRWKEKKLLDGIFGEGFVDSYLPEYESATWSFTMDGEEVTVNLTPSSRELDPT